MTKVTLSCFCSSYRFLRWWAPCGELPVVSSLWVWQHPWSRVDGCHLLLSSPFMAFHIAFSSSPVPFILHSFPFMLHSFPFILLSVLSCPAAMYQRYRSSKTDMLKPSQTGQAGMRPNAHVCFIFCCRCCCRFAYRFGGLCRLSSSGFMNTYMYKLVIFFSILSFSGPATHWQS